ncbi:unnamed protein product [Schistosoma margrebowiei]|uniref:Uncharacterized protein n=1 Tax=Schistosoma margrebowiei TaxID=48269 RepID=A0A183MHS6_9TREM|nr:unnamed protein product [Schistosoma margrebowiei]
MVVGGSQQETLEPSFVLLDGRQQGVPVILRFIKTLIIKEFKPDLLMPFNQFQSFPLTSNNYVGQPLTTSNLTMESSGIHHQNLHHSNPIEFPSAAVLPNGSQQETMDPGFMLLGTRQQGEPVILRELVLPGEFDLVSPSFTVRDVTTELLVQDNTDTSTILMANKSIQSYGTYTIITRINTMHQCFGHSTTMNRFPQLGIQSDVNLQPSCPLNFTYNSPTAYINSTGTLTSVGNYLNTTIPNIINLAPSGTIQALLPNLTYNILTTLNDQRNQPLQTHQSQQTIGQQSLQQQQQQQQQNQSLPSIHLGQIHSPSNLLNFNPNQKIPNIQPNDVTTTPIHLTDTSPTMWLLPAKIPSQQETLDQGFVLLGTRQQGVPVILRELLLPGGFDLVSPSFTVRDVTTELSEP